MKSDKTFLATIEQQIKPQLTKDLRVIVNKQYTQLLSPSTKIMKAVVEEIVRREGSPEMKLVEMMNRVNSA